MSETTKLSDPADKSAGLDQFTQVRRNGGWTVEQWIDYLDRNPHATLPSGVGGMIVGYMRAERICSCGLRQDALGGPEGGF